MSIGSLNIINEQQQSQEIKQSKANRLNFDISEYERGAKEYYYIAKKVDKELEGIITELFDSLYSNKVLMSDKLKDTALFTAGKIEGLMFLKSKVSNLIEQRRRAIDKEYELRYNNVYDFNRMNI